MKLGDLITVYFSGKESGDEVVTGVVLRFKDYSSKKKVNSKIHLTLLRDGRVYNDVLYWDDEVEVLC